MGDARLHARSTALYMAIVRVVPLIPATPANDSTYPWVAWSSVVDIHQSFIRSTASKAIQSGLADLRDDGPRRKEMRPRTR